MKIGFQHMGTVNIPVKALIHALGGQVFQGPPPNRKTAQTGAALAPEMVCLPMKITLGDMVSCLEQGADTLLFLGSGDWSCRFGYYGRIQHQILKKQGYAFTPLFVSYQSIGKLFHEFQKLSRGNFFRLIYRFMRGCSLAFRKSQLIELTEELGRRIRPLEKRRGECSQLVRILLDEIDQENTFRALKKLKRKIGDTFQAVARHRNSQPLRVCIIGESYCVIEPLVNFNLIDFLGEQQILVEPFLTSHRWLLRHTLRLEADRNCPKRKALALAKPYWKYGTGGEDQLEIGYLLHAIKTGIDGVVHLMPFGCMPETAALPVLERITCENGIPMLNLSLDEHSGISGIQTRIEAFADLLKERKRVAEGIR